MSRTLLWLRSLVLGTYDRLSWIPSSLFWVHVALLIPFNLYFAPSFGFYLFLTRSNFYSSPCALSNECAPFCNYLEKYHECDPARRLSLAVAAASFVTVEITPTPPKPAHNGRNLEERLVGPANF